MRLSRYTKKNTFLTENYSNIKSGIGTILIVLTGVSLNIDKIIDHLDVTFKNLYGMQDSASLIFNISQSITPLLILIAAYLRPYFFSFIVPAFFYLLQIASIFKTDLNEDTSTSIIYTITGVILLGISIFAVKKVSEDLDNLKNLEINNLLEENKTLKEKLKNHLK